MTIEIDGDKSNVIELDDNGTEKKKTVMTEELLKSLSNNEIEYESDILPGPYGVRKIVTKGKNTSYLYIEEPRKVKLRYNLSEYRSSFEYGEDDDNMDEVYTFLRENNITVEEENGDEVAIVDSVTPITAWMVKIYKNEDTVLYSNINVFALKTPVFTGNETLYRYPYSNVYDDAKICWGEISLQAPSSQSIQGLSTLFLGSYFNLDLPHGLADYPTIGYGRDTMIPHVLTQKESDTVEGRLEYLHRFFREYSYDDYSRTVDARFKEFILD